MEEQIRAHLERQRWAEAFDLIASHYRNKVFHLALAMLGDREQAEDVAQEALLRIWKALPGYRGAASLSTWIFAIARNASLTALKTARARRTVGLEDAGVERKSLGGSPRWPADPPHLPDVEWMIAQLPEQQRQVVRLFYMEEKSYEEVARMLDLPMGTVKTHLHRARKELALRWRKETADAAVRGI